MIVDGSWVRIWRLPKIAGESAGPGAAAETTVDVCATTPWQRNNSPNNSSPTIMLLNWLNFIFNGLGWVTKMIMTCGD
jgi:hypothetical protein